MFKCKNVDCKINAGKCIKVELKLMHNTINLLFIYLFIYYSQNLINEYICAHKKIVHFIIIGLNKVTTSAGKVLFMDCGW